MYFNGYYYIHPFQAIVIRAKTVWNCDQGYLSHNLGCTANRLYHYCGEKTVPPNVTSIYIKRRSVRAYVCMYVWLRRVCIFWENDSSSMDAIRKVKYVSEKCDPVDMHGRDATDKYLHGQLNEWAYTMSFIKKDNFWKRIIFTLSLQKGHFCYQACINKDSSFLDNEF